MTALLPSHDRPTDAPVAGIPAQRGAPAPETHGAEPVVLPRQRPAAVLGVVAGMAVGAAATLAAAAIMTAPAVVPEPATAPRENPEPRIASAGTAPGGELTSFGDGTWQVGVDVLPGTYASVGGRDCRHAFRPAVTGRDIVAGTVGPGPATVALAVGNGFFDTSGCGTWSRVG